MRLFHREKEAGPTTRHPAKQDLDSSLRGYQGLRYVCTIEMTFTARPLVSNSGSAVVPPPTTRLPSPQMHPASNSNGSHRGSLVAFDAADFSAASSPFGVPLAMNHSRFPGYTLDTYEERSL